MILKGGKEAKITRRQIWAVSRMFQVVHLKHCKELCWSCEVGPNVILHMQNTCCNRAVQDIIASWLLVTFLGFRSMTLHWSWCYFPWNLQQYTLAVPKHFASRFAYLEFFSVAGTRHFSTPSLHVLSPGSDGEPTSCRQRECVRGNHNNEWHIFGGMSTNHSLLLVVFR